MEYDVVVLVDNFCVSHFPLYYLIYFYNDNVLSKICACHLTRHKIFLKL